MEEKEKKPWRPPEAAHLPDPIAVSYTHLTLPTT